MTIKPVRVTAYLSPELARRVRVVAAERGVRQTDILREAVEEYLNKEGRKG